jgi:DNA-binding winged helix-turn-helix (wHTH) protein
LNSAVSTHADGRAVGLSARPDRALDPAALSVRARTQFPNVLPLTEGPGNTSAADRTEPASGQAWESPHHAPGTVLAIVPVDAATTLAIVGYLVQMPRPGRSAPSGPQGLVVDRDNRQVLVDSREAGLTFQEFELLDFLISNPGRVFSRGQLLDFVWGYPDEGLTRTVDVHIHRLRRKLGPEYAGCVVTVRRVGYRFTPAYRRTTSLRTRRSTTDVT